MPDPTKQTLSATQTPALFGASPYLTRWMLLRHFIHGDPIDGPAHNRMDWGKRMQPLILAQAAEDLHLEVRPNADDAYVRRGLLGCTRDAIVICPDRGPGALECKAVFDYGVWMTTWDGGKTPPKHVEIQTQQQMMVGDDSQSFTWGVIAVWVCGEMKYFERKPIDDLWVEIIEAAAEFFDDVAARREGDPFGDPVEMPLLNALFPIKAGKVIDLTNEPNAEHLAEEVKMWAWHAAQQRGHQKGADAIKAKMRALIGNAQEARLPHGVVVRAKQQSRKGYTVAPTTFTVLDPFVPEGASTSAPGANILAGG